jgi:hypothetical protein
VIRLGVEKLRLRRWLSLLIVYLVVAAVSFGAVLFLPVMIIGSIAQIDVAAIVESIDQWVSAIRPRRRQCPGLGVPCLGEDPFPSTVGLTWLKPPTREDVTGPSLE